MLSRLAGPQRLHLLQQRPTHSELLDGIDRRLWFVHRAAGSFSAPAATESAPAAPAAPTVAESAPDPAPDFAPANDLPRHLRHRQRYRLPGRRLGRDGGLVRVRDGLQ